MTSPTIAAMTAGRQADSQRRRERVQAALAAAVGRGDEITITSVARGAGVDRTFLYRHHDLLDQVHAAQARPSHTDDIEHGVTRASLHADLLASQQRCTRLAARTRQLESRLSALLGQQTWHESGLGAPDDIDGLHQRLTALEQQTIDLRLQLQHRNRDLDAARAGIGYVTLTTNTTDAVRPSARPAVTGSPGHTLTGSPTVDNTTTTGPDRCGEFPTAIAQKTSDTPQGRDP